MRRRLVWATIAVVVVILGLAIAGRGIGFTSRAKPWALEEWTMRTARGWGTPGTVARQANPVESSPEVLREAMEHWADHCALCHGNDGSGHTGPIKGFYPPAPDMRRSPTQDMSDGEMFYVIERGIPLTGMPAWGNGTPDGEKATWALVRFIRHLPSLTEAEITQMEKWNPKSAAQMEQERKMQDFLKGKGG